MNNIRHRMAVVRVFIGTFLACALSIGMAADAPPLNPPVKIRINTGGLTGEGGIFLAYDKGYFAAEGLQVELVDALATNSSTDTLTQLATGSLDLGVLAPNAALLNALNRGVGLIGVMPLNTVSANDKSTGIVVRQDLIASGRYKSPQDLKGMKIGVLTIGGAGHYNVLRALEGAGLKDKDVELATMSFPDTVVALANKSIDAAFEVEPFIDTAQSRNLASLVIPSSKTSLGAPSIVLYTSTQFAKNNSEAIKRFTVAVMRGQRDYLSAVRKGGAEREALLQTLKQHTSLKDINRLRAVNLPSVDPNGYFDQSAFQAVQKFYIATGVQNKMVDTTKMFDRTYVDYALNRLGKQ